MGNLGGALGTLLGEKRKLSDRRRAISAFTGMAGAMGALFPSPILSVLLIHELSITSRPADTRFNAAVTTPLVSFVEGQEVNAQHDFMEQVCLSGIAASSAYAVFYGLAEKTFLTPMKLPFAMYALSDYQVWHLAAAIPLGIISGLIGIIALICIGLFRKVS
jgi:H+/Cl- antiporter ClcA